MKWDKLCGTDRNRKLGRIIWDGGSNKVKECDLNDNTPKIVSFMEDTTLSTNLVKYKGEREYENKIEERNIKSD